MSEKVLLGDEAVALGAIHAGISAAYGYPGTPSTEIMEYLQEYSAKNGKPLAKWCSNEKTAYEDAVGTSMVNKRAIVTMKHVGLNVAADAFMNSVLLDIQGGLVLVVADDPGMHSSQSEQDTRYFTDFAKTFCFEPRNQQEAYEMTKEAFEVSEKFNVPVVLKLVTRLSHSRAVVKTGDQREENPLKKFTSKTGWITLPSTSRAHYAKLLKDQEAFIDYSESTDYNPLTINPSFKDYGVITTGLGRNYYEENKKDLENEPSHLHISVYPMPVDKIRKLAESVDRVLVIEEGYSYVERLMRGVLPQEKAIDGKENGVVPPYGELNPDNVRQALNLPPRKSVEAKVDVEMPGRPPQLCMGCPHKDTFDAMNAALGNFDESIVTSDIGCYTLGFLPPYEAIETALCMGASIGMAKGAAEAGYHPVVATIGDGTFMHSGVPSLVDAISANTNMTLILMDNCTTGMTGGQDTILSSPEIQKVVEGIGVDPEHIKVINPLPKHTEANTKIVLDEINYKGLSVIIPLRECIQTLKKKK